MYNFALHEAHISGVDEECLIGRIGTAFWFVWSGLMTGSIVAFATHLPGEKVRKKLDRLCNMTVRLTGFALRLPLNFTDLFNWLRCNLNLESGGQKDGSSSATEHRVLE